MNIKNRKWYKSKQRSDDIVSAIINLTYILGIDADFSYIRKILLAHPDYRCILLLFLGINSKNITIYKNLISLMTLFAATYSAYLLLYQLVYLKKICLLCLVIQICIWSEFFILIKSFDFGFGWFSVYFVIIFMLCMLTTFITWKAIRYCIYLGWKLEKNEIEFLKTRRDPEYINFVLSKTKKINTGMLSKELEYGGDDAIFNITLVIHPICKPCQETFRQFNKLVRQGGGKVKGVIRILSGTKESDGLDVEVTKIVFYYLLAHGVEHSLMVLKDWFSTEKKSIESVKKRLEWLKSRYPCIDNDLITRAEYIVKSNRDWGAGIPIVETPTIFINDRQLPRNLNLSDLTYHIFYNKLCI